MRLISKTKKKYIAPCAYSSTTIPEGLICASFNFVGVEVDELHNMNTIADPEECYDFEL